MGANATPKLRFSEKQLSRPVVLPVCECHVRGLKRAATEAVLSVFGSHDAWGLRGVPTRHPSAILKGV